LWKEMAQIASREGNRNHGRKLVDAAAAQRLEALTSELAAVGVRLTPQRPSAMKQNFPPCLLRGIDESMRIFREEVFGPIIALLPLPESNFAEHALALSNSPELAGDLAISLFTANPDSTEIREVARRMRHGMVTINAYPGVAFATSLPWGA